MCRHTATTVVASDVEGEPVAIHQCDLCGLTLPGRAVADGETPHTALDDRALTFAVRHALRQAHRWFADLETLRRTDRCAYRAEVCRLLGAADAGGDAGDLDAGGGER